MLIEPDLEQSELATGLKYEALRFADAIRQLECKRAGAGERD